MCFHRLPNCIQCSFESCHFSQFSASSPARCEQTFRSQSSFFSRISCSWYAIAGAHCHLFVNVTLLSQDSALQPGLRPSKSRRWQAQGHTAQVGTSIEFKCAYRCLPVARARAAFTLLGCNTCRQHAQNAQDERQANGHFHGPHPR